MAETAREIRFCYRCGKRVGKNAFNCWYCSAPTARTIRPPRHCPFCQSVIGPKAIKCPHCSEFVDGRPQQNPQHLTLNIDKAVFGPGGMQGFSPGQPQQPMNPNYDPSRTIDVQGYNQIPQQGAQQALPSNSPHLLPGQASEPPQAPQPGAIIRRGNQADAPIQSAGNYPLGHPAAPQSQPLGFPQPQQPAPLAVPGAAHVPAAANDEEQTYATCPVCNTEILAIDNYCYYCGQLHSGGRKIEPAAGAAPSNGWLYFLAIVLCAAVTALREISQLQPFDDPLYRAGMMLVACLTLVWAFFRNKKIISRVLTVVVVIACIVILSVSL